MPVRRVTILLVCAFVILLSAVAGLVIRQARGDHLESTIWMNAVLVLVGLLILARATLGPNVQLSGRCQRCGGPTFDTTRTSDRHALRTCFSCGNEDASATESRPGLEPPPAKPADHVH